jgi:hypothetical protein
MLALMGTVAEILMGLVQSMSIIVPCTNGATESQLKHIEATLGVALPADYRFFLMTINGGAPRKTDGPVLFRISWDKQPWAKDYRTAQLAWLDTADNLPGRSLAFAYSPQVLRQVRESMPNDTIPIGGDRGSNVILLGITGENRGKVFFWANDYASTDDDAEPTYDNVGFIANSFTEFLQSLYPWKEDPE